MDTSYVYVQNQDVAAAAWKMKTRSKLKKWEGSSWINAENSSSYGEELYGIYIVLRFIIYMLEERDGKPGVIKIKCDDLTGVLDFSKKELKIKKF